MQRVFLTAHAQWLWLCCATTVLIMACASADQVDMQNGDRYLGKVVSLNTDTLVLQNDVLGTINLPRTKVALITLGAVQIKPAATSKYSTNAVADPNGVAAKLNANSNLIAQVQKQFLSGADPAANEKFNELVSGLLSGKLNVEDIKAQARATAEQVKASRKDLGESGGWALDAYLAILDQFIGETTPPPKSASAPPGRNASPSPPTPEE